MAAAIDQSPTEISGRVPPPRPARTEEQEHDILLPYRPSKEVTTSIVALGPGPTRLRKKRSNANMRASIDKAGHGQAHTEPAIKTTATNGDLDERRARKGSLRKVVRRIFGMRTKEQHQQSTRPPSGRLPSRHGHNQSDPGVLRQSHGGPTPPRNPVPQRLSAGHHPDLPTINQRRTKSPYAVEFPQSARLKPLDLGNPFTAPQAEPRRRATLPSLVVDDREAAALAEIIRSRDVRSSTIDGPIPEEGEIGLALSRSPTPFKRRSRSADDMATTAQPLRGREEEIRYWRESHSENTIRRSTVSGHEFAREERPPDVAEEEEVTPNAQTLQDLSLADADPAKDSFMGSAHAIRDPSFEQARSERGRKPSLVPHDSPVLSRPATAPDAAGSDLDQRVTNIEHLIAGFQQSLDRLAADANRKNSMYDAMAARNTRQHTPSILVDTLRDPQYHPPPLQTQPHPSQQPSDSIRPPLAVRPPSPPARTFTALYNILTDERSARRTLENEVRTLQQDMSEIQYQLSQPIITRQSRVYMPRPTQQQFARSHVRELSNTSTIGNPQVHRLMSRFSQTDSLTDSEAARLQENKSEAGSESPTHEAYKTPTGEEGKTSWEQGNKRESETF